MCTAMLLDPNEKKANKIEESPVVEFNKKSKLYERWMRIKQTILLSSFKTKK